MMVASRSPLLVFGGGIAATGDANTHVRAVSGFGFPVVKKVVVVTV